jgi:hypothetical protein
MLEFELVFPMVLTNLQIYWFCLLIKFCILAELTKFIFSILFENFDALTMPLRKIRHIAYSAVLASVASLEPLLSLTCEKVASTASELKDRVRT